MTIDEILDFIHMENKSINDEIALLKSRLENAE